MTNVRAVHRVKDGHTACGRRLGAKLRGGNVYMNGTHRLIVAVGDEPVSCGKCNEKAA